MTTYYCIECGQPFEAEQRRDYHNLGCVDEYRDRIGLEVDLDPVLARQARAELAEWEIWARKDGGRYTNGYSPVFPTERNGRRVYLPADEMSDAELQAIADQYDISLS